VLALVWAVLRVRGVDLDIAARAVSSPLGYIWLHLNPALPMLDWPAGSAEFRFSLPMRLLLWLVQTTSVTPSRTLIPFGLAETVLMAVAFGYLAHVLFQSPRTTVALTIIGTLAPVAGINLGNFGAGLGGYSPVLFYDWAHAFGFLAHAFILRDRLAPAAIMAALAMWSHVAMGLYVVAFLGGALLVEPARLLAWRTWGAMLLLIALCAPLAALFVEDAHLGTGGVAAADWILMSRMFNWHWYPIELGLFGPFAEIGIFPILVLVAGYIMARRHVCVMPESADARLMAGMVTAGVLTVVGILVSEVWPVPVLIKLALPRASEWISLVMLAYIVRDLVRRMEAGSWALALLSGWTLAALVLAGPGIALAPLLLMGLVDAAGDRAKLRIGIWGTLLLATASLAIVDTLVPGLSAKLWPPFAHLSPWGEPDNSLVGGRLQRPWFVWVGIAAAVIFTIGSRGHSGTARRRLEIGQMAVAIVLTVLVLQVRWEDWGAANRARAAALKDAQLWAQDNTAPDAIFMGDPAVPDGWREYSGRAYYGSLAELAHYATLYDSIPGLFERGIRRVREFGVDPMSVDPRALRLPGGGNYGTSILSPQVSAAFAKMSADELRGIAARHGVSYLIVRRAARTAPLTGLSPVYSNAEYDIYDLRSSS
jgi:hypothetical protein